MIILSEDYAGSTISQFLSKSLDCVTYLGGCGEFRKVCAAVADKEDTHVFLDAPKSGTDWRTIHKQLLKDAYKKHLHTKVHLVPCTEYYLVQWLKNSGFQFGRYIKDFNTEEVYFKRLLEVVSPECGVIEKAYHGKLYDVVCSCCADTNTYCLSVVDKSRDFHDKCATLIDFRVPEQYTIEVTEVYGHMIKHIVQTGTV